MLFTGKNRLMTRMPFSVRMTRDSLNVLSETLCNMRFKVFPLGALLAHFDPVVYLQLT